MSQADAKASLTKTAETSVLAVVKVGDGYEGASADATTMHFWRTDSSGRWVEDGSVPRLKSFSSAVPDDVEGKVIRGSDHAVFILHAGIGGTGSSPTAQAYARSAQGWGSVASSNDDGSSITISRAPGWSGAWHDAGFGADTLKLNSFVPGLANADGHDVVRSWVMNGDGFQLVGTDDPSTKAQKFTTDSWAQFTSPSGKNTCEITAGSVACALSETVRKSHGGASLIVLGPQGWVVGPGDLGINEDGGGDQWALTGGGPTPATRNGVRILSYGSTITSGELTCTSSTQGFDCTNGTAGFNVNSQSLTTRGRQGPNPESNS